MMGPAAPYSYEMADSADMGGNWAGPTPEQARSTVEIPLDPELLTTLYRRSRRRLRDIQASCQALLKLDRARSSLHVSGNEEAIWAVRRHLENLSGPCKPLPLAVWAELMRTRTLRYGSCATIAHMQNKSGCRIHIERGRQEVRLFGPKDGIAVADKLLDEFSGTCGEEVVSVGSTTESLSSTTLQALAHAFRVTLRLEDQEVIVLGIKSSVAEACKELHRYVEDPEGYQVELLPEAPESETEEQGAAEAMAGGPEALRAAKAADGPGSGGAGPAVPARKGAAARPAPPAPPAGRPAGQSGQRSVPTSQHCQAGTCCHTCGAAHFCSGCGMKIWQINFVNVMPADQGMLTAGMPMQPGYETQVQGMTGAVGVPPRSEQPESFEPEGQVQKAWGPVQQPQMMYCMDPKAASKAGMVPVQFPAMPGATQPGQMGMMQACMVPVGMIPTYCGL